MSWFGKDRDTTEHGYVEERLSAYLDGELSPQERETVDRHLATCEACRWDLHTLRQTVLWTRELPAVQVPRVFTIPVPARPVRQERRRWTFLPLLQGATALVALLLVFVVAGDLMMGQFGPARAPEPAIVFESGPVAGGRAMTEAPMAQEAPLTVVETMQVQVEREVVVEVTTEVEIPAGEAVEKAVSEPTLAAMAPPAPGAEEATEAPVAAEAVPAEPGIGGAEGETASGIGGVEGEPAVEAGTATPARALGLEPPTLPTVAAAIRQTITASLSLPTSTLRIFGSRTAPVTVTVTAGFGIRLTPTPWPTVVVEAAVPEATPAPSQIEATPTLALQPTVQPTVAAPPPADLAPTATAPAPLPTEAPLAMVAPTVAPARTLGPPPTAVVEDSVASSASTAAEAQAPAYQAVPGEMAEPEGALQEQVATWLRAVEIALAMAFVLLGTVTVIAMIARRRSET